MRYQSVTLAGFDGSVTLSASLEEAGPVVRVNGWHRLRSPGAPPSAGKLENQTDAFRPGQLAEATLFVARLIYGRRRDGYAECTNSEAYEVRDLLQRLGLDD